MSKTNTKRKKQKVPTPPPASAKIVADFLKYFVPLTSINLVLHESKNPPTLPGGHTIFRHINVSDAQLQNRVKTTHHDTASRFTDLDTATVAITETIAAQFQTVLAWASSTKKRDLSLYQNLGYDIGVVYEKSDPDTKKNASRIVINFHKCHMGEYPLENSIITSYPTLEVR